jgi:hypothetical protein
MESNLRREQGERGFVLVLALLMLLVLTLIGVSGMSSTNFEISISGNKRISEQAFYVAEAGINEFMARFNREGATQEITDSSPSNPDWRVYLGTNGDKVAQISGNPSQSFVPSLQNQLNYAVAVRHKLDATGSVVTKNGVPVYIVTSHGFTPEGGNRVTEVEISKTSIPAPPAALYSKAPVQVKGTSTYISGMDNCPSSGSGNKPGIMTTTSTITETGGPTILGQPAKEINSTTNLPLLGMVDALKGAADYPYDYNADITLTGLNWGTPTTHGTAQPLTYDGALNIVYFNMGGDKTVKLAGQSKGAGVLLVDGNLELNGGFTWYGEIIVTGSLTFTGGGEKNITGGVLVGESATVNTDVGGDVGILYCSDAEKKLKAGVPSYKIIQWREVY